MLDLVMYFNISISSDCQAWLYNSGALRNCSDIIAPPAGSNFTITLDYPTNETHYNLFDTNVSKQYTGYINLTTNVAANCTLNDSRWDGCYQETANVSTS
ncbi:unnamed protein product, partial [marine sediment metagenome]